MEERILKDLEVEGLEEEFDELEEVEEDTDSTDGNINVIENILEFLKNSDDMYVTFCQRRFVTKIRKLAEKYPEEVTILSENTDGSIYAKLPVRALHLSLVKREMTDEQKIRAAERLQNARNQKKEQNK